MLLRQWLSSLQLHESDLPQKEFDPILPMAGEDPASAPRIGTALCEGTQAIESNDIKSFPQALYRRVVCQRPFDSRQPIQLWRGCAKTRRRPRHEVARKRIFQRHARGSDKACRATRRSCPPTRRHSETDIDTQVNAVENFITKKVDAIVIAPADSRALVAPLARAIKAGIVVINIDVALDEQAKKQAGISLAFVGPDNRAGAKLAGDELAKALGKRSAAQARV